MAPDRIVTPGMRICAAEERYAAGPGTYSIRGYIYSSLVGILKLLPKTADFEAPGTTDSAKKEVGRR